MHYNPDSFRLPEDCRLHVRHFHKDNSSRKMRKGSKYLTRAWITQGKDAKMVAFADRLWVPMERGRDRGEGETGSALPGSIGGGGIAV